MWKMWSENFFEVLRFHFRLRDDYYLDSSTVVTLGRYSSLT